MCHKPSVTDSSPSHRLRPLIGNLMSSSLTSPLIPADLLYIPSSNLCLPSSLPSPPPPQPPVKLVDPLLYFPFSEPQTTPVASTQLPSLSFFGIVSHLTLLSRAKKRKLGGKVGEKRGEEERVRRKCCPPHFTTHIRVEILASFFSLNILLSVTYVSPAH